MSRRLPRAWLGAALPLLLGGLGGSAAMAQPSPTAILDGLQPRAGRGVAFHARTFPDTVFVGEQLTYQVAVLLAPEVRQRLRRNPEFVPPAVQGMLAFELGTPREVAARVYPTGTFEAFVFQRALFAVVPGRVLIPAPTLTYTLPQSASYFSREERVSLMADTLSVVIRPLPTEGQPDGFLGAVGAIDAAMRVAGAEARVGEPVVVTVRLEGTGNVRLWPRPVLEPPNATVVPNGERLRLDTTGSVVRGVKEFDYLVTPAAPGLLVIPALRYVHFDPRQGRYLEAGAPSVTLAVEGTGAAFQLEAADGLRPTWRPWRRLEQEPTVEWLRRWRGTVWGLAAVPWLVLGAVLSRRWRRPRRPRGVPSPGGPSDEDAATGSPLEPARRARRRLLAALSAHTGLSVEELTDERQGLQALRQCGVTRDTAAEVVAVLRDLATRAFSEPGAVVHERPLPDLEALARRVGAEAIAPDGVRPVRSGRGWRTLLVGGLFMAGEPTALEQVVRDAETAFGEQRYALAAERLSQAVRQRPTDVDLLVNWGTAAWAASDTVAAVQGWQRAARLVPLDPEVHDRLRQLPAGARDGLAAVPHQAVPLQVVMAAVLWLLGWAIAWQARGRSARLALAAVVLAGSVVAAVAAWRGARALDGSRLYVVGRPETLLSAPLAAADAMGGVGTGDVVRVDRAADGWALIRHADGRSGWLPLPRLVPLLPTTGNR